MSPEERQLLTGLFDRIRGAAGTPRDPEAEALISDAVRTMPYAPYLLAQAVIVQDQALQAANGKIQELEARLRDLEQQPRQATGTGGFLSGLGSIFGGGNPPPPRPAPQPGPWGQPQSFAPPPPAGGPWGGNPGGGMGGGMMGSPMGGMMGGGGFLQGALGAAAGVAGGVLLADSIRGLFGAHNNPLGIGSGFAPGLDGGFGGGGLGGGLGGETVINNYYGDGSAPADSVDYSGNADSLQNDSYDASFDDAGGSSDDGSFDV